MCSENNQLLISIIVPIFNVEKYIRQCVDSILCQTYKEIEIILVDDGSPDNCGKICDEYASIDERVIVIHKENGGLSSARNAGIDIAKGEYLGFIDADDWIKPDMYESMLENMIKHDADISVCGSYLSFVNSNIPNYDKKEFLLLTPEQAIVESLNGIKFNVAAWDKLYKKSIFEDLRYPEGMLYEDRLIIIEVFDKCKNVVVDTEPKYYYRQRSNSIMKSIHISEMLAAMDMFEQKIGILKRKYQVTSPSIIHSVQNNLLRLRIAIIIKMLRYNKIKKKPGYLKIIKFLIKTLYFYLKEISLQDNVFLWNVFQIWKTKRKKYRDKTRFE